MFVEPSSQGKQGHRATEEEVGAERVKRAKGEGQAEVLYVLALFGPTATQLQCAVHAHKDWLGKSTGELCMFLVAGDPKHSDDEFLKFVSQMGLPVEDLRSEWQAQLERHVDSETAKMRECFAAAEWLGIPRDDLPCLVYALSGAPSGWAHFHLPLTWWLKPELADGLAAKMVEVLDQENVRQRLERADDADDPLEAMRLSFGTLQDGVDLAEAYELGPNDVEVLQYFQGRPDERILSGRVQQEKRLPRGTASGALSKLTSLGLLHNSKRRGYKVTSRGVSFVL